MAGSEGVDSQEEAAYSWGRGVINFSNIGLLDLMY